MSVIKKLRENKGNIGGAVLAVGVTGAILVGLGTAYEKLGPSDKISEYAVCGTQFSTTSSCVTRRSELHHGDVDCTYVISWEDKRKNTIQDYGCDGLIEKVVEIADGKSTKYEFTDIMIGSTVCQEAAATVKSIDNLLLQEGKYKLENP
jgi:hypothetical protein